MRGSRGRAVSPATAAVLAPPVGEDLRPAGLADDRIQSKQRFGAVRYQRSEDIQARKPHGCLGDRPLQDRDSARRQTRLEGLVAKSATERGATFSQEESF